MDKLPQITFCIPSKSNLRYLKYSIPSIRENSFRKDHKISIFVDSDEDGTVEWLEANKDIYGIDYFVNPYLGKTLYGIGKAYDYLIEQSTTDVFMVFHADMIMAKDMDLLTYNHLGPKTAVCPTRIEPPLHPNLGEKIIQPFGLYPEEFTKDVFTDFVENNKDSDKVTDGIFAPWMMNKDEFLSIGGHDPRMHSCREDSDVFNRLALAGFTFKQPWNAFVYHFTGRGAGQFSQSETEIDKKRHAFWKKQMHNSTREFVRKWKSNITHTNEMKPIVSPKYNIGIVINNCNNNLLTTLEPWSDDIYVDCDIASYYDAENNNTTDNLLEKVHSIDSESKNDIVVILDGSTFNQQDFDFLMKIQDICKNQGKVGKYKLGNIEVHINKLEDKVNDLIYI
mgnify:FL=1